MEKELGPNNNSAPSMTSFSDSFPPVSAELTGDGDSLFIFAPGAGSNLNSSGIVEQTRLLEQHGAVLRFNFPYREAGKSIPDPMPKLVPFYRAVIAWARSEIGPRKLYIGGHSMGGRVASMVAAEGVKSDGLILFSYPLHPAGKPEKLRVDHLPHIQVPVLAISGTNDELCETDLMLKQLEILPQSLWTFHWVGHADHSLHVTRKSGRTNADVKAEISQAIADWLSSG